MSIATGSAAPESTPPLAPYPAPYPEVRGRPTLLDEVKKMEQMLLDASRSSNKSGAFPTRSPTGCTRTACTARSSPANWED